MYDIIIIGSGPAGMTAAIYAKIAKKNVLVIEKGSYGGQILKTNTVKNYPGYEDISGYDFSNKLYNQMMLYKPDYINDEVVQIIDKDDFKEIITKNSSYKSKCVLIATGATNRKLGLPNEEKLTGKGISYCAVCDGMFFKKKVVAITGGGNQAIDEALYLSDFVKTLYVIYRREDFKFESINLENLKKKENVIFKFNSEIVDLYGEEKLSGIKIKTLDKEEDINLDGLFIAIGHIPVSSMCNNLVKIDKSGYIIADENCNTSTKGIFACGDVRVKNLRQLTTACSDGSIAAIEAIKYINLQKKTSE